MSTLQKIIESSFSTLPDELIYRGPILQLGEVLGSGGYGEVHEVIGDPLSVGPTVAKTLHTRKLYEEAFLESPEKTKAVFDIIARNWELLHTTDLRTCEQLIRPLAVRIEGEEVTYLMKRGYAPLEKHLPKPLTADTAPQYIDIINQTVNLIDLLHSKGFWARDFSLDQCFINKNGILQMADLDLIGMLPESKAKYREEMRPLERVHSNTTQLQETHGINLTKLLSTPIWELNLSAEKSLLISPEQRDLARLGTVLMRLATGTYEKNQGPYTVSATFLKGRSNGLPDVDSTIPGLGYLLARATDTPDNSYKTTKELLVDLDLINKGLGHAVRRKKKNKKSFRTREKEIAFYDPTNKTKKYLQRTAKALAGTTLSAILGLTAVYQYQKPNLILSPEARQEQLKEMGEEAFIDDITKKIVGRFQKDLQDHHLPKLKEGNSTSLFPFGIYEKTDPEGLYLSGSSSSSGHFLQSLFHAFALSNNIHFLETYLQFSDHQRLELHTDSSTLEQSDFSNHSIGRFYSGVLLYQYLQDHSETFLSMPDTMKQSLDKHMVETIVAAEIAFRQYHSPSKSFQEVGFFPREKILVKSTDDQVLLPFLYQVANSSLLSLLLDSHNADPLFITPASLNNRLLEASDQSPVDLYTPIDIVTFGDVIVDSGQTICSELITGNGVVLPKRYIGAEQVPPGHSLTYLSAGTLRGLGYRLKFIDDTIQMKNSFSQLFIQQEGQEAFEEYSQELLLKKTDLLHCADLVNDYLFTFAQDFSHIPNILSEEPLPERYSGDTYSQNMYLQYLALTDGTGFENSLNSFLLNAPFNDGVSRLPLTSLPDSFLGSSVYKPQQWGLLLHSSSRSLVFSDGTKIETDAMLLENLYFLKQKKDEKF